ncbi:MAG TPA: hemolysin family protein, partial [Jiangellaceae bacterium]|nr:hemolysin family protein [Jiangellaceae bacterium]
MIPALLLGILALVAANALFVAAEFSFISVDRSAVERRAEQGDTRAASVLAALKRLSTQLSGAQLGITVTSLVVGYLAEPSLGQLLRGPVGATGLSDAATTSISVILALVLASGFQMVFGELVPKNWGIAEPMRAARLVAGPQRAFTTATYPLIRILNGAANRTLRLLGIEPREELAAARSAQELVSLVGRSQRSGMLDDAAATLLTRSLRLGGQTAADAMTPRPRTVFVGGEEPVAEVLRAVERTGHSRFPVSGRTVDQVVGLVHFKHALRVPRDQRENTPVREVMVELPAVPMTM